jgi:hypothetical protein
VVGLILNKILQVGIFYSPLGKGKEKKESK